MLASRAAPLHRGRHIARAACTTADLDRALALRSQVFRAGADDSDRFDPRAIHVVIEDTAKDGAKAPLAGCFRLIPMDSGADIHRGYAADSYDLTGLAAFAPPILELGRFCLDPAALGDPDLLRLAWAFITREVDARGAGMLCGCTSFKGRDPALHRDALALLAAHLAPPHLAPRIRAAGTIPLAPLADLPPDPARQARAIAQMPPLLRTYLTMGGWVSDHAVPDPELDTLHVFTAVEIAAIPPARARLLRALAE